MPAGHVQAPAVGRARRVLIAAATACTMTVATGCAGAAGPGNRSSLGTLKLGMAVPPVNMDPAMASSEALWAIHLAYDPLIYRDPQGKLEPRLATSWGYVGTGNRVFELKLRPNVQFSDGSPLTADVVKDNLTHFRKASPAAAFLADVSGIDVVDPTTLKLTMAHANPDLPTLFTQDYLLGNLASGNALKAPGVLATHTVGAGPYVLDPAQTVPKDHYTYTPNSHYWNKKDVHYKKIVIKVLPNANTALAALKTGQVDVIQGDYTTARAAKSAGLQVKSIPRQFVGLGLADRDGKLLKPLGDVRVRQALNFAVDRQTVATGLFGAYGAATEQVVMPGQPGYSGSNYYHYDPATAKKLLAEAGYPHGFTLPVVTSQVRGLDRVVQAIASDLKKVGVQVKMTSYPDDLKATQERMSGKWPAYGISFGSLPIQQMGPLLFLPGAAAYNPLKSSDKTLSSLYDQAGSADPAQQQGLDRQIVQRLVEQAWFVVVVATPIIYYARSTVAGLEVSPGQQKADPVAWKPA
jgi:peptide/nickel transport system substrate-binding protein